MFQKKKRFGQHFLINQAVLSRIARYCKLKEGERCVEIGPGQGALTDYLLATGCQLHCVELDKRLEKKLQQYQTDHPNFSYTMGDALLQDWDSLLGDQTTVVGNLPYEISTPLLFQLVHSRSSIKRMVFLLQKEVVERMAAKVGTKAFGRLSVMTQYYFQAEAMDIVMPEDFSPPPKVVSQVVVLKPIERDWVDAEQFEAFVKDLFASPRKMIRQRYKDRVQTSDWASLGIDPTSRPGNLDIDTIIKLYRFLA